MPPEGVVVGSGAAIGGDAGIETVEGGGATRLPAQGMNASHSSHTDGVFMQFWSACVWSRQYAYGKHTPHVAQGNVLHGGAGGYDVAGIGGMFAMQAVSSSQRWWSAGPSAAHVVAPEIELRVLSSTEPHIDVIEPYSVDAADAIVAHVESRVLG